MILIISYIFPKCTLMFYRYHRLCTFFTRDSSRPIQRVLAIVILSVCPSAVRRLSVWCHVPVPNQGSFSGKLLLIIEKLG